MINYIIKKILYGFLVLWGVLTIVFFLFNILPGDPARMMLDQRQDSNQLLVIKKKYAFDRPLIEQYALYLNDVSPFSIHYTDKQSYTFLDANKYSFIRLISMSKYDIVIKIPYLRDSFVRIGTKVTSIIKDTSKNTFILAISAIFFALIIGLLLGIITALNKDTLLDRGILFCSVIGMSLPSFFSSILIAWIFGFVLHAYTGLSMTGSLYEVDDYGRGSFLQIKNLILHLMLCKDHQSLDFQRLFCCWSLQHLKFFLLKAKLLG